MIYLIALFLSFFMWFTGVPSEFQMFVGVIFVIGVITQLSTYYNHVFDIEKIEEHKKDASTYKKQADDLLAEVKMYLIDKFPEHELKIFDKITKNTADFLAIEYPEIKSDDCFKKAVNNVIDLKGKIYRCELEINKLERKLAVRARTVTLSVIPILPVYKKG